MGDWGIEQPSRGVEVYGLVRRRHRCRRKRRAAVAGPCPRPHDPWPLYHYSAWRACHQGGTTRARRATSAWVSRPGPRGQLPRLTSSHLGVTTPMRPCTGGSQVLSSGTAAQHTPPALCSLHQLYPVTSPRGGARRTPVPRTCPAAAVPAPPSLFWLLPVLPFSPGASAPAPRSTRCTRMPRIDTSTAPQGHNPRRPRLALPCTAHRTTCHCRKRPSMPCGPGACARRHINTPLMLAHRAPRRSRILSSDPTYPTLLLLLLATRALRPSHSNHSNPS